MKKIILFLTISISCQVFSQEKINLFSKFYNQAIGLNEVTKDSIYAQEIYYEYMINDHSYDSIHNSIIVKLQMLREDGVYFNEGLISCINLDSNKVIWSNLFSYNKIDYQLLEDNLIFKNKKEFFAIDPITQERKWRVKSFIINQNEIADNIGVTIEKDNRLDDKYNLIGINTKTGDKQWESELFNKKKFIIDYSIRNGNQFYFINNQLNSINLTKGEAWNFGDDFSINTGNSNSEALLVGSLLGGVLGYALVSSLTTSSEFTAKSYSNFIFLDNYFYIANYKSLYKFNYKNELVKEVKYSEYDKVVNPELYYNDSIVFLVNKGRPYSLGLSTLISYDINLELKKYKFLGDESVIDINFKDSFAYIVQYSRIKKINFHTNQEESKPFKGKNYVTAKSLFDTVIYFEKNKSFTPINIYNPNAFYLKSNKEDSISEFDLKMNLIKKYSIFRFSKLVFKNDKLKFIQNKSECFILNNEDKLILELPNIEKVIYRNHKYYISLDNQIMIIDEKQLVK